MAEEFGTWRCQYYTV